MSFPLGFDNGRSRTQNARPDSGYNDEPSLFSFFDPPSQPNSARSSMHTSTLSDARASLHRRFTTTNLPTTGGLAPIGQPRMQSAESQGQDTSFSVYRDSQLRERKQAEYEFIKKKRLQFQHDMLALERKEQLLRNDLDTYDSPQQSEPATPPERFENGFPSSLSRPNRFSTSSLISPIGTSTRSSLGGAQMNSPGSERDRAYQALTGLPPQSVSSPRESIGVEEDDKYEDEVLNFDHRKAASLNRNSMPITRRDHGVGNGAGNFNASLGQVDTTSFLFEDNFTKSEDLETTLSSKNLPTYLQMHTNSDKFPVLVRRDNDGATDVGNSSDSVDPSVSRGQDADTNYGGWPNFARNSSASQGYSLSQSEKSDSPPHGVQSNVSGSMTPTRAAASNRHSMGARIGMSTDSKRSSVYSNGTENNAAANFSSGPKLHPSLSTSSVPTMNSINAGTSTPPKTQASANATAEQRLHNHNMSLGRIPPSASAIGSNRHSRDLTGELAKADDQNVEVHSPQGAGLQGNAPAHSLGSPTAGDLAPSAMHLNGGISPYGATQMYGYGVQPSVQPGVQPNMQMLQAAMNNMNVQASVPQQWNPNPLQVFPHPYMSYNPFQHMNPPRFPDNQSRPMQQQRRNQHGEDSARFQNIALESLQGEILGLCKDQHGCRYLQKKLEERKPEHIQIIFAETKDHMIELMIDPFGNYLCQKLLEFANDDQRTELINSASPEMVTIALNQHGTRALQKMIEFVSTSIQIQTVILALQHSVVQMIQDLNGNHVIQKCLNRLTSQDAQFIFDAVAAHCVTVGTHRHGCCVIQRCIDHASASQKAQLVNAINNCSMELVQDPFGNYVLQYIFDLEEPSFTQPLCRTFLGQIPRLSKQKFSSNVVEKCIRIADIGTRHEMIQEIVNASEFEKLADDPFANYVVQTAWDHADSNDEAALAEKIRPCLPRMRHKPYGRRFQNKVAERDKKLGIAVSGTVTPNEMASPETMPNNPLNYAAPYGQFGMPQEQNAMQSPQGNFANFRNTSYGYQTGGYGAAFGQPQQAPMGNPQAIPNFNNQYQTQNQNQNQNQGPAQQSYAPFGRGAPNHGTRWY